MYWTATTEQGSQVGGKPNLRDQSQRLLALSHLEGLAPSCEGSANPPQAEPRLRAERERRFTGRAGLRIPGVPDGPAGFQPCLINAARSAFQCAAFLAACIRSVRGAFVLALTGLAPSNAEGSRQVFAFRRRRGASPHWPKLATSRPHHPVSIRQCCRVESPLTCAESDTSVFLPDNFPGGWSAAGFTAESPRGAGASHTLPSRIHFPKGLR
jgi:hypothetical protein